MTKLFQLYFPFALRNDLPFPSSYPAAFLKVNIFTFIFLDGEIWVVDHFWKKTVQEIMSIFGIIFVHGAYCLNDL